MRRISLPPADPNSVRGEIERKAREQEEEQARKSKLKRRRDEAIGQVVTEFKRTCKRAADAGRSSAEQTSRARTAHLSPGAKPRESDVCAVEAGEDYLTDAHPSPALAGITVVDDAQFEPHLKPPPERWSFVLLTPALTETPARWLAMPPASQSHRIAPSSPAHATDDTRLGSCSMSLSAPIACRRCAPSSS